MSIKNYTTKIGANQTVAQIHNLLSTKCARQILSEYGEDSKISAIAFQLVVDGKKIHFRLPARVDGVLSSMQNNRDVPRRFVTREHAQRVAWRIIYHWIEAQIAIVEAGCAEFEEVFLPYAITSSGETVFESIKRLDMKMIAHGED